MEISRFERFFICDCVKWTVQGVLNGGYSPVKCSSLNGGFSLKIQYKISELFKVNLIDIEGRVECAEFNGFVLKTSS